MTEFKQETQRRFIAHVLKDSEGEKLDQVRALPADVFTSPDCAKGWRAIRRANSYDEAATHAAVLPFWSEETSEIQWRGDLQAARIAWFTVCNDWDKVGREISIKKNEWPALQNAQEHYSDLPYPPTCIVDGLLIEGGVSICSAPSKNRKSWFALHLGFAVAMGGEFIGRNCRQGPVIYLNYELRQDSLHRRLHDIRRALDVEMPEHFHVVNLRGTNVTVVKLRKMLAEFCQKISPSLIILDPFYKVSANSGAEENSNDGQARLLDELEAVSEECKAALFIVHHFAKGNASGKNAIDRASGAGALARAPDAVLTLSEHEEEDCCVLTSSLRDLPPLGDIPLRWEFPLWSVDETLDTSKLKKAGGRPATRTPDQLLDFLKDGMASGEWLAAAREGGWGKSAYYDALKNLKTARKIRNESGFYYHPHIEAA